MGSLRCTMRETRDNTSTDVENTNTDTSGGSEHDDEHTGEEMRTPFAPPGARNTDTDVNMGRERGGSGVSFDAEIVEKTSDGVSVRGGGERDGPSRPDQAFVIADNENPGTDTSWVVFTGENALTAMNGSPIMAGARDADIVELDDWR